MIAEALRRASASVEDFRGDYEQLAAVVQASWGEAAAPPYFYSANFLADCFRYPGSGFSLAPAIYRGSDLLAFAFGHPRRVKVAGAQRQILISTFLTVAPEHKMSGYGIVVWTELMRRAAEAGFDGVINYCVEGEAMDRMVPAGCRLLELPVVRVASFSYLSRSLSPREADYGKPESCPSAEHLMKAAAGMPACTELSRLWTEEEAAWQLSRLGAVSAKGGTDADPAVLTGYVIPIADEARTPCLVIEDVLWGQLAADDCRTLARNFITKAVSAGARVAILPRVGYADTRPFAATGFLPSPHTVHTYLTMWSQPAPQRAPERYYLDVI